MRSWRLDYPLDIAAILLPLRRGYGDPTFAIDLSGAYWLTANTPAGAGTLQVTETAEKVTGRAWGLGAEWLLDQLFALLGGTDHSHVDFSAHHDLVAKVRIKQPGLRLGATGRVWDALLPAVIEQKVTQLEAFRSYRELCRRFGEPAPGPTPKAMRVPPTPAAILRITEWEWHRVGVDYRRRRTLIAAAQVAHQLANAANMGGRAGRELLRKVPGIGVRTAAEVAQRAWGDPDAVSFGDFHLPKIIGWALYQRRLDDAGLAQALADYIPQRQRAVRYILATGIQSPPRFGPRLSPRDYRAV